MGGGILATILGGEMVCNQLQEYLVKVREDGDNTSEDENDLNRFGRSQCSLRSLDRSEACYCKYLNLL
jgi:hypothetical protein